MKVASDHSRIMETGRLKGNESKSSEAPVEQVLLQDEHGKGEQPLPIKIQFE